MSGSYLLKKRLTLPDSMSVVLDVGTTLGGLGDSYMVNGGHRECHPDFVATPIGDGPHRFLVCQRKKEEIPVNVTNYMREDVCAPEMINNRIYTQSHNLYDSNRNALPGITRAGGQPLALQDRRYPYQQHFQGQDYYRDGIKYRNNGTEKVNTALPGDFGYKENKYYFSSAPPVYDVTQLVQPFPLWKREQLRMGTFTIKEMEAFENQHNYTVKSGNM